jgi:hypothetical protein
VKGNWFAHHRWMREREWSEDESRKLRELVADGETLELLSAILNRRQGAIAQQAARLGLHLNMRRPR